MELKHQNSFAEYDSDRFHMFVDRFENSEKATEICATLREAADAYGLQHIAYAGFNIPNQKRNTPFLAVTYKDHWVKHYIENSYFDIDPVITQGLKTILPVDWNTVDRSPKIVQQMFDEAEQSGVGNQGISIPVRGRSGDRAICCLTAKMRDYDWDRFKRQYIRDFQALAVYIHHSIVRSTNSEIIDVPLSKREAECLYWAACGKTADEIGIILKLSRRGVRFHLANTLIKMDAMNVTQAASKAITNELDRKSTRLNSSHSSVSRMPSSA